MADITTSTLDELLKRTYAAWEIEQLINLTYPLLATCAAKGSAALGGAGFYFPVRNEAAEGHAYIDEDGNLPSGRYSVVRQATVPPKVQAGVVQLTGLSMAVSGSNAMAFAEAFDENVNQTLEAMSAYNEGVLFRDGTGVLAEFADDPDTSAGPHDMDDVGFLREGMYVDVIKATASYDRYHTGIKIKSVDWVNQTVTFADGTALDTNATTGDQLYLTGSQAASGQPDSKEPIGLEGSLLDSGTYLGISRTDYVNWKSNVLNASAYLDEDILFRARTRVTQESGIGLAGISSRMKLVCHPSQANILFKLGLPRVRYSGTSGIDLGNSEEVKFGGIPVLTSYLCPMSVAYLGDWKYSKTLYTPGGELSIDTKYNGAALKWVATRDVGLVFARSYRALAVTRPNAFIRIHTLTEASR
jgi:hypothetical protein